MHTVRLTGSSKNAKWVVQFIREDSTHNVAWFTTFFYACTFASWLNGGLEPAVKVFEDAEYIKP